MLTIEVFPDRRRRGKFPQIDDPSFLLSASSNGVFFAPQGHPRMLLGHQKSWRDKNEMLFVFQGGEETRGPFHIRSFVAPGMARPQLEVYAETGLRQVNVSQHGVHTIAPVFVNIPPSTWVKVSPYDNLYLHFDDVSYHVSTSLSGPGFAIDPGRFMSTTYPLESLVHLARGVGEIGLLYLARNRNLQPDGYAFLASCPLVQLLETLRQNPSVPALRKAMIDVQLGPPRAF